MPTYVVELRNANTFKGDEIEGYIGIVQGVQKLHPTTEDESPTFGVVKGEDDAHHFEDRREADRVTKNWPDAFFDRYYVTTAERLMTPDSDGSADPRY